MAEDKDPIYNFDYNNPAYTGGGVNDLLAQMKNTQGGGPLTFGNRYSSPGSMPAQVGEYQGFQTLQDLYGRQVEGTGKDIGTIREAYRSRLNQDQGDIASNQLRGQRNTQMQGITSKAAKAGVTGGSRLAMADQAGRSADRQIASVQDERGRQNLGDFSKLIGNEASTQISLPKAYAAQNVGGLQRRSTNSFPNFIGGYFQSFLLETKIIM